VTERAANFGVRVGPELVVKALPGLPTIVPGDDLPQIIGQGLEAASMPLQDDDLVVVASKIVSRAEGCFVDLSTIGPGEEARRLADDVDKDPALVELILRESQAVSRKKPGVLITRHKLGFVSANAGIDSSNAAPQDAVEGTGPWVLTLPRDPDATAARLRAELQARFGVRIGVILTDSWGRPFRHGTIGFAIGLSGLPGLWDRRGAHDRHGRMLEFTETGLADAVAAAADLVAGQADEGRPVTLIRGLRYESTDAGGQCLVREADEDLYA
jgi:coenzyme F420-0:L-glutamate ligase/coenzyme F420-1:gamma-L-glutamate ligase